MKITDLIKKLEKMKSLYGDLPVHHETPGDEMEGFDEVGSVSPVYGGYMGPWMRTRTRAIRSVSPVYGGYMGQDKTQPVWCIELA